MRHEIVDNINAGIIINNLFNDFLNIKTGAQSDKLKSRIAKTYFGTYKNNTILDVIEKYFPIKKENFFVTEFIEYVKYAYRKFSVNN